MVFWPPSKPPTRMEWAIVFWLMIAVLVVLGGLYLYFGLAAAGDAPAETWVYRGLLFLGAAGGAVLVRRLVRWWANR